MRRSIWLVILAFLSGCGEGKSPPDASVGEDIARRDAGFMLPPIGDGDGDGDGDGAMRDASAGGDGDGDAGDADAGEPAVVLPGFQGNTDIAFDVKRTNVGSIAVLHAAPASADHVLVFALDTGRSNARVIYRFTWEGALDPSYGSAGSAMLSGISYATGRKIFAADGSGRAYSIASSSDTTMVVTRLDASGQLDATFGTQGMAGVTPEQLAALPAKSLIADTVLATDDAVYVAGYTNPGVSDATRAWIVIKLALDGTVDKSFGEHGYARIESGHEDSIHFMHRAPDGALYAGGPRADGDDSIAVVKLDATGALDGSYGDAGVATLVAGGSGYYVHGIATDSAGRLVAFGSKPSAEIEGRSALAIRMTQAGERDASFGDGGELSADYVTLPHDSAAYDDVFDNFWMDGDALMFSGFTRSATSNRLPYWTLARADDSGVMDLAFPFTENLGHVWDASYATAIEDHDSWSGRSVALPTPDGEHVIGIGLDHQKTDLVFVRWE